MLKKKEITSLIINAIFAKMLLSFPRNTVVNSHNSAWIQVLFNFAAVIIIFFITTKVYKEKKCIIELADQKGGKWFKIPLGIIVFLILMINFLSIIRIFPETVKIVLLKDTPINIIVLLFAITAAFGAYMGIESISRIHYIFLPIAAFIFVIFLIMLAPYYDINNIMPILGSGMDKIFISGFKSLSLFSDIILLNVLLPHAKTLDDIKKGGFKAIIISGVSAVIVMLAYCLVYPYPVSENFVFPIYQLARVVHLSSFFSRFEAFFQFVWSILIMLYASLYIYAICLVLQKTFSLRFYKPLIFPVVVISYSVSLIPTSLVNTIKTESIIAGIDFPLAFILPVVFGLMTKRKKNNSITGKE